MLLNTTVTITKVTIYLFRRHVLSFALVNVLVQYPELIHLFEFAISEAFGLVRAVTASEPWRPFQRLVSSVVLIEPSTQNTRAELR